MNILRWGLLSTANINRRLIPAIRAAKRSELVAVASRSKETATTYAQEWGIPQAFSSYQAMLDSGEINALYISLPNHLHAEWSIKALNAGINVLCEKPFALSLAETDEMIATAKRNGRFLAEAFMYRHHPQTKLVGQLVKEGKLGEITLIQGSFNFAFRTRDNIRLIPEYGGGSLWDVGIYPMSFAQFIYGSAPKSVIGNQWIGETGVDENFAAQMHYPCGGVAQISCAFRTPWHTQIEIIGTKGRLSLNRPFVSLDNERHLLFYPAEGEMEELPVPEKELYLGEVEDMETAVLDDTPQYLNLSETRNHIQTLLALYQSANTGQKIYLPNDMINDK